MPAWNGGMTRGSECSFTGVYMPFLPASGMARRGMENGSVKAPSIPVTVYDTFVNYFNPVKFDADEWVKMAKNAGMQYIVITTKHHDGFCLFDSKYTDFDVMSTPFKRDIMKEMSEACRNNGMKMCWYHSIMDWHHPDYLPRRSWELEIRPEAGARV